MLVDLTEEKWLAHIDAIRLLRHLQRRHRIGKRKAGCRKVRLFACAVCRQLLWDVPLPPLFHSIVETAERYAEHEIKIATLTAKDRPASQLVPRPYSGARAYAANAMRNTAYSSDMSAAYGVAFNAVEALKKNKDRHAKRKVSNVLREIFGNPFHAPAIDDDLLCWKFATLPTIARVIYDERRFADLPVLADALEEAGCTDAEVLRHCREPGEHVRGCWVLDLLLGKDYQK
jgi:hypothetical protein